MRIALRQIWRMAREREPGFLDAMMEKSRFDESAAMLELTIQDMKEICECWPVSKRIRGLGDIVHLLAKPIAILSDAVRGTDYQHCVECEEKRQELNEKFPL